MSAGSTNSQDVFINCRFDPDWNSHFEALVFAVIACGFKVRCAREMDDAAGTRIDKLYQIIAESRFGIHDLSCVELDPASNLPRFNMPLELGFFLAAKRYGGDGQKEKRCLIFDSEPYRYQRFISDLNGMDFTPHNNDAPQMVISVRNFLQAASRRKTIPTGRNVALSHASFVVARPDLLAAAELGHNNVPFADFEQLVLAWVREDERLGSQA
jgi:hypothetical protein